MRLLIAALALSVALPAMAAPGPVSRAGPGDIIMTVRVPVGDDGSLVEYTYVTYLGVTAKGEASFKRTDLQTVNGVSNMQTYREQPINIDYHKAPHLVAAGSDLLVIEATSGELVYRTPGR